MLCQKTFKPNEKTVEYFEKFATSRKISYKYLVTMPESLQLF